MKHYSLLSQLLVSVNANTLLSTGDMLELNGAVDKRKESVIGTDTNVVTGMNLRTALSYQNITGENCLTVSLLNAKALRLGITTVLGRTNALLVGEEL